MLDCNCCSQILPESAFYKETRTKRGYQRRCKSCQKAGAAYSYEKNQDGKCLICGSTDSCHNSGQFVVDHCHSTGVVRGLLCHHCNLLLGHAKDSTVTLQAAINYLNNHG